MWGYLRFDSGVLRTGFEPVNISFITGPIVRGHRHRGNVKGAVMLVELIKRGRTCDKASGANA